MIAQVPAGTNERAMPGSPPGALSDAVMEMFQTLLADRFRLKLHKEEKPLPGYALSVSRKLQLKEADGSGDTGCRMLAPEGPTDTTVRYACRNVSMEASRRYCLGCGACPSMWWWTRRSSKACGVSS